MWADLAVDSWLVGKHPLPVTVIIPCFNDGDTLPDAVQSALGAVVNKLLIVNDGSTDAPTRELLQYYEHHGVMVLHTPNAGVAAARTHALDHVATPYVFNLDADDELLPGGLAHLYDALCRDASCEVAWGDYCAFGQSNHLVETADCIDAWQLTLVNDLPVSALFRTEALRRVGGWQVEGYEDWDLWMGFADHGFQGRHEPLPVFRYRTRPSSAMRLRSRVELRHDAHMAEMRTRHPTLFSHRTRNWLRSCVPWRVRLTLLVVSLIPLSGRHRTRALWKANQLAHGRLARRLGMPGRRRPAARA